MNGREIECLVTFCCSFSAWKYVRQKVGCYYQLHATSIPQYHSSYSQPTISPSVDVIALTPGPLDSTLYFHQWKYSSWVLNLPPNLLEDLSLGEQEFRLPFLSSLNPWSPSHSCTCGKNHYDLFSCLIPLFPLVCTCAADILSATLPLERRNTGNKLLSCSHAGAFQLT